MPNEAFWWHQRSILAEEGRDYAVANQGQLKWVATQAYQEFEAKLPGGAGSNLTAIASSFVNSNNYAIVNQGQLKYLFSFEVE